MAASVGPYRLCSSALSRSRKRACRSRDSASPLQMTRRSDSHALACGSCRKYLQHRRHEVHGGDPAHSGSAPPGRRCPGGHPGSATTRCAPASSGQKNSHTETSKLNGVFCSTTIVAGVSSILSCIQSSRLTMPPVLVQHAFRTAGRPGREDHVGGCGRFKAHIRVGVRVAGDQTATPCRER